MTSKRSTQGSNVAATEPIVVFDLGGVVCRFTSERRLDALSQLTGLPATDIHQRIWGSRLDERAEHGQLSPEDTRARVLDAIGATDPDLVRAAWAAAFQPDQAVLHLVARLRVPAVLLSNNGPLLTDCLEHELRHVRLHFAGVYLSWQLGATKPDLAAFRALAARAAPRTPIALIDDDRRNLAGPTSLGWHAIHYRSASRLEEALDELGLLTP